MMAKFIWGIFRGIDRGLTFVIKLSIFVAITFFLYFLFSTNKVEITTPQVLQMSLSGRVVESHQPIQSISEIISNPSQGRNFTIARIQKVLDVARHDPLIKGVYLDLKRVSDLGFSSAVRLHKVIDAFQKRSGKDVWIWMENYTQSQYLVASAAKHVGIHPLGSIQMKGLSMTSLYWGKFLKTLGIDLSLYKVGEYKTAPEPLIQEAPSLENIRMQKRLLDAMWQQYQRVIQTTRGFTKNTFASYFQWVNTLPGALSFSEKQKELGWVTDVTSQDIFEQKLYENVNLTKENHSLHWLDYLQKIETPNAELTASIAVVSIEGRLLDGGLSKSFSKEQVVQSLRQVGMLRHIRAVVVRINSPGGDVFVADQIRQEIRMLRTKGKKVVVSMGDYAASGGYWIATAADYIIAEPGTLTGSIGVFSVKPTIAPLLQHWNIGVDGYRTSPLARMDNVVTRPSQMEDRMHQHQVQTIYKHFLSLVAEARHMSEVEVDEIAQGQVWLGAQAKKHNLVDALGGLEDALHWAIQECQLRPDAMVWYVSTPVRGMWQTVLSQVSIQSSKILYGFVTRMQKSQWLASMSEKVQID